MSPKYKNVGLPLSLSEVWIPKVFMKWAITGMGKLLKGCVVYCKIISIGEILCGMPAHMGLAQFEKSIFIVKNEEKGKYHVKFSSHEIFPYFQRLNSWENMGKRGNAGSYAM